jgi:hypothetical protein
MSQQVDEFFFFFKKKKLSQRKKFNKSYHIRKKGWGHGGHVDILWWGRELCVGIGDGRGREWKGK